jgi:uncharacterized pyridoxamine 5'-phosphate oxidase family protein
MNLLDHKELIENNPIHIATVNPENIPNLAVAADVRVLENDSIVISVNEMNNTPNNIEHNPNVVITVFDNDWVGLRMFGKAKFYTDGEYYEFCKKEFFSHNEVTPSGATQPKGAIIVKLDRVEEYK